MIEVVEYSKPREFEEAFSSSEDNIRHLTECEGCTLCDELMNHYEACDNCGAWGQMSVMPGVVRGSTATVLCPACMKLYENDPDSVYIVPEK